MLVDVTARGLVAGQVVHGPVELRPGGSPVNAALAGAALGARCAVVGRVGADPPGAMLRAALLAAGVDALLATDGRAQTGIYLEAGAGAGKAVLADRGASGWLAVDDLPDPLRAGAVLVSGYALLHDDTAPAACAALQRADARFTAVSLAVPERLRQLGLAGLRERAHGATVVLANEHEARALTGRPPAEAAARLAAAFGLACVTSGAEGAVAATADGEVVHASPAAALPGEQTGAGDVFAAALLLALERGRPLGPALRAACDSTT